MTPEAIVRALAAATEPIDASYKLCALCGGRYEDDPHEPDCPWRLAVEWVAANDRRGDPICPDCREKATRPAIRTDGGPAMRWCSHCRRYFAERGPEVYDVRAAQHGTGGEER